MNAAEQTIHWHKFNRFQQRYEQIFAPKFNKALKEQIKQYTDHGTLIAVHSTPVYKVLHELYTTVSPIYAASSTVQIRNTKSRAPIGFNERIVQLMHKLFGIDLLNKAEQITQTTKEVIERVLKKGASEGLSFSQMVSELQSTDLTASRARLIARTETLSASNAAANIAARDTGLDMNKVWISAKDKRVRIDHQQVDGSIIGMDDKFYVGATLMKFPGDPAGGASEVCNCRCTVGFIPKRDANDRLIRLHPAISLRA